MLFALLAALTLQSAAAQDSKGIPSDLTSETEAYLEKLRARNPKKLARVTSVDDHWFMVRVRFQEGVGEANHASICTGIGVCHPVPAEVDERYVRLALSAIERVGGCAATFDRIEKVRVFAKIDCSQKIRWSDTNR
ncbi:hypothetical protein [Sphingomonas sp. 3-13AW]|uniref:hypothetical protein n=1 Tax=Sphingomonas sp. 3-13AW TaxID=3050450 RepID=UPI003BB67192